MAATTELQLIITAKDQATATLRKFGGTFSGISGKFNTEINLLKRGALLASAAIIGVASAAVYFGVSSVQAFAKAQAAQKRFEHGLKTIVKASDEEISALRKQQLALQRTTRFEDDAIASAQAFLATFQINAKQIEKITPQLLDMAEGLRDVEGGTIGLEQASTMLGKAMQLGTLTMLRRVGVTVPGTTKAMQDLFEAKFQNANMDERLILLGTMLKANFEGQAVAAGNTLAGKIAILTNEYANLKEAVGEALNEALTPLLDKIVKFIETNEFQEWLKQTTNKIKEFAVKGVELATKKVQEWYESIGGREGLQKKLKEWGDYIENNLIPAMLSIYNQVKKFISLIWEHKETILKLIVAYEIWKIATTTATILTEGLTLAVKGLNAAIIILRSSIFWIIAIIILMTKVAWELDKKLDGNTYGMRLLRVSVMALFGPIGIAIKLIRHWKEWLNIAKQHVHFLGIGVASVFSFISKIISKTLGFVIEQIKGFIKILDKAIDMLDDFGDESKDVGISSKKLFGSRYAQFGGAVSRGQSYIVGERRPEVFVPSQSGNIKQIEGGEITVNFNNPVVRNDYDLQRILDTVKRTLNRDNFLSRYGVRSI